MTPLQIKIFAAVVIIAVIAFIVWQIRVFFAAPEAALDSYFSDSRFIEVDGFKIRYVQRGATSLPHLVLIHGIGASIYSWREIIDPLSKTHCVTAFDLPGFGLSDKLPNEDYGLDRQTERTIHFLNKLGIDSFNLVGHSMGGAIAAWLAKTHPTRIRKLALISPALSHNVIRLNPDRWWWGVHILKNKVVTLKLVLTIYKFVTTHRPKNLIEVVDHYYRPYHGDPNAVITFYKHIYLLRDTRLTNNLESLTCPILILHGAHDPIIKQKIFKSFVKSNPNAKIITDSASGHMPAEENPTFVTENLNKFFDT